MKLKHANGVQENFKIIQMKFKTINKLRFVIKKKKNHIKDLINLIKK